MRRWGLLLAGGLAAAAVVVAPRLGGPDPVDAAGPVYRYEVDVTAELLGPLAELVRVTVTDQYGDADLVFVADRRVDLGALSLDAVVAGPEGTLVMGEGEPTWDAGTREVTWPSTAPGPVVIDEHFAHVANLRVHRRVGPLALAAGTYLVEHELRGSLLRLEVTATAVTAAAGAPLPAEVAATVLDAPPAGTAEAALLADGTPVFVVGHADRTGVVGAVEPHNPLGIGSLVAWCAPRHEFTDVLYGSQHDSAGGYVGGPAPRGLVPYEVTDGGNGTVEVTAALAPPPREVQRPPWALPPRGPHCFDGRDGEPLVDLLVQHAPEDWPPSAIDELSDGWARVEAAVIVTGPQAGDLCAALASTSPPACAPGAVRVPGIGVPPEEDDHGQSSPSALVGPLLLRAEDGRPVEVVRLPGVEHVGDPFGRPAPTGWTVGYLAGADPTGESDPGLCHEGCPDPYVSLATATVVTAGGDIHVGDFDGPPPDGLRLDGVAAGVVDGGIAFGGTHLEVTGDLEVLGADRLHDGMSIAELADLDLAVDPVFVHVKVDDGLVTRIEEHPRPLPRNR